MPEGQISTVVPAQLSFLALYNPLLGATDETIDEQIVFYTSRTSQLQRHGNSASEGDDKTTPHDDKHEKLRQIGLAQGMVSFARNFSEGRAVDYVETERSQIVLHELEKNWWILASVDLTRLPADPATGSSSQRDASESPSFCYSSREMFPPQLLIQQLRRAHSIFLLHHASNLDELYGRVGRSNFCTLLDYFWLRFAWSWDVLLTGNPIVEMYNGIKLAVGGELGVGVGEEEWGSGEREVLEHFVSRTDGLIDLVVSRFGDPYTPVGDPSNARRPENPPDDPDLENQWLGSDAYPQPSDGVIFSGVGAIARPYLVQISQWTEWVYRYGYDAYGVGEDPTSPRRRKRRKKERGRATEKACNQPAATDTLGVAPERPFTPGIPRPLVRGPLQPPQSTHDPEGKASLPTSGESSPAPDDRTSDWMSIGAAMRAETFVKYLTLGYGSSWGFASGASSPHPRVEALKQEDGPDLPETPENPPPDIQDAPSDPKRDTRYKSRGKFIIGLHDGTTNPDNVLEETEITNSTGSSKERILKRTLHVRLATSLEQDSTVELRAVIYMHQPFIYTFLFDSTTSTLSDPSLYHSIHHQLGPLQKPLSNSTSPANAAARISISENNIDFSRRFSAKHLPVYDLVYDPSNLSIRSSIPNVPDLGSPFPEAIQVSPDFAPLSRVESINIHHRLLSTYIETRSRPLEVERTCKTSRGWWIVWVRIPQDNSANRPNTSSSFSAALDTDSNDADTQQEAFLIRKASDHSPSSMHGRSSSGSRFFRDLGGASSPSWSTDIGPGKLVEGLGLDARRYIENLLSLSR